MRASAPEPLSGLISEPVGWTGFKCAPRSFASILPTRADLPSTIHNNGYCHVQLFVTARHSLKRKNGGFGVPSFTEMAPPAGFEPATHSLESTDAIPGFLNRERAYAIPEASA